MRTSPRGLGQPPFDRLPWAKEEKLVKAPKTGVCIASVCACVPQRHIYHEKMAHVSAKTISNHTNNPKQVCALRAYVRACHKGNVTRKYAHKSAYSTKEYAQLLYRYNHSAHETLNTTWSLTHLSMSKGSTFRKLPSSKASRSREMNVFLFFAIFNMLTTFFFGFLFCVTYFFKTCVHI